jgi:thiamine biosynthesis lipoprotein
MRANGSAGVCVNLGGDLRVVGRPPSGERWSISIDDPFEDSRELLRVGICSGAVATSSRLRRVWGHGDERLHHVIDPRTGRPADIRTAAVTAVARSAWWAEVAATSSLLAPDPLGAANAASVVAIDEDGHIRATPDLEEALT